MRQDDGRESENIEDRRGMEMGGGCIGSPSGQKAGILTDATLSKPQNYNACFQ